MVWIPCDEAGSPWQLREGSSRPQRAEVSPSDGLWGRRHVRSAGTGTALPSGPRAQRGSSWPGLSPRVVSSVALLANHRDTFVQACACRLTRRGVAAGAV